MTDDTAADAYAADEEMDALREWSEEYRAGLRDDPPPLFSDRITLGPKVVAWFDAYHRDPGSVRPPIFIVTTGNLVGRIIFSHDIAWRLVLDPEANPGLRELH